MNKDIEYCMIFFLLKRIISIFGTNKQKSNQKIT